MQVCLATSLATIVFTSPARCAAMPPRARSISTSCAAGAPGIAIGAIVGVLVAGGMKTTALMLIFGVLGTAGRALSRASATTTGGSATAMPKGIGRAITAPVLGFLSVLMGIGGGSFGVPLMRLYGVPIHRAVGTASGFGLIIAVPSVIGFLLQGWGSPGRPPYTVGLVNLPAFLIVIGVTMITTTWGVRLAHAMNPKPLKRVFAAFIMVVALNMLRKALIG